jgi:hypothetical protein
MAFNLDAYEPVADRIAKFWDTYPTGRLHTEIVLINETEIVIKASAFTDREDLRPASIDFAQETRNSSAINKQNFVENCATSALGRCLATLNFQPKRDGKAVRPSREEMRSVSIEWDTELELLVVAKDLDGLRNLYKKSIQMKAMPEVVDRIKAAAENLK